MVSVKIVIRVINLVQWRKFFLALIFMFQIFSAWSENVTLAHAYKITQKNLIWKISFITKNPNEAFQHRVHTHLQLQYPYPLQSCAQASGNSPKLRSHIPSAECSKYYTVEFLPFQSERKLQQTILTTKTYSDENENLSGAHDF